MSKRETHEHCWHREMPGFWRMMLTDTWPERCCHCGTKRYNRTVYIKNEFHGPHAPKLERKLYD